MNLDRRLFLTKLASLLALFSVPDSVLSREAAPDHAPKKTLGRLGDLDERTVFDVCIIGSGFAGAVLGEALVEHGARTVILESGMDAGYPSSDLHSRKLEVFQSSGPIDYPIATTRVRAIGGTSAIWTGRCPRMHPQDFEATPHTAAGDNWPITYSEIEPYYEEAEKRLRVRGGKLSKENPPRKNDLPLPADRDISRLKSLLQVIGVTVDDAPTSTGQDGHRPIRVAESYLPSFQASPYAALVSGATVSRLLVGDNGRIAGAEVKDLGRNVKVVRARAYVIACGGLESPRLLLLSRSRHFPNGIGNSYDWVGRCFMEHRVINFYGRVKATGLQIYPQVGRSSQFDQEFRSRQMGSMTLGFLLMTLRPGEVSLRDPAGSFDRLGAILGRIWRPELRISASPEMPARRENRVTLDRRVTDYFGNPVINLSLNESDGERRIAERAKQLVRKLYTGLAAEEVQELDSTWSHHHIGTCRMGDNPRTSVVDRNLRVHGTSNLFVSGSSVFVSSGSGNPTLTLTALSLRLANYIRSELQGKSLSADIRLSRDLSSSLNESYSV